MSLLITLCSEELALLRGVCAEPLDHTPRLVLADWYEETGQTLLVAFAHFIRQHVADGWMEGESTKTEKRERAKSHLLKFFGSAGAANLAGNVWAARLFNIERIIGYTKPQLWERGFPSYAFFGSVVKWMRSANQSLDSDRLYERIPLVGSVVKGRSPAHRTSFAHPPWIWTWNKAEVHYGKMHKSNLPAMVYKWLPKGSVAGISHYHGYAEAAEAACLAFTDAGRVACGLSPRHASEQEKAGA